MFDALFPGWQNPALIALIVGLRILANSYLVALVGNATGVDSPVTAVAAGLTVLSAVIMIAALRPGLLGLHASYVEVGAQVVLLVVAGYAVVRWASAARAGLFVLGAIVAVSLLAVMIPIYGEAFVAP